MSVKWYRSIVKTKLSLRHLWHRDRVLYLTAVRVLSSAKLTQSELKFDTVSVCSKVASSPGRVAGGDSGQCQCGHQGSILGPAVTGDWLSWSWSTSNGGQGRAWLVLPGRGWAQWLWSARSRSQGPDTRLRLRRLVTRLEGREHLTTFNVIHSTTSNQ